MATARSRKTKKGKWVFVPNSDIPPEEARREAEDDVMQMLSAHTHLAVSAGTDPFEAGMAAIKEFTDYFPGKNEVPKEGGWILVKEPPFTEFTVPPMSIWFATPWPMEHQKRNPNRVKIITPRGQLGLFPHEYSLIDTPSKYYEFLGQGMELKFFSEQLSKEMLSQDKIFYIRAHGISLKDAIGMVLGDIKQHGVCWIETSREVTAQFGMKWADESRLATVVTAHKPVLPARSGD